MGHSYQDAAGTGCRGTISLDGVASSDDDDAGDTRDNTAVVYERLSTRKVKKAVGQTDWHKGTEPSERLTHERQDRRAVPDVEKEGPIGDNRCVYDLGCRTPGSTQGHTGKRGRASSWGFLEDGSRELIGVMWAILSPTVRGKVFWMIFLHEG